MTEPQNPYDLERALLVEMRGTIARLEENVERLRRSLHALWQTCSRMPGFIDTLASMPDPDGESVDKDMTPRLQLVKGGGPDAG